MALMHKMRQNMQVILFFLLFMFVASMTIGGLVGGANILDFITGKNPNAIAIINGEMISYKQFSQAYQQELEAQRAKTGIEPQGYQLQNIENQVWESLVRDVLLSQEIKKRGIKVTDAEILFHIYNNPPEILKTNQSFLDDKGEFDRAKYQAALNDPANDIFWRQIEDYLRITLPFQKLYYQIIATVRVTDEELREEFVRKNQKVKVSYIFFDPMKFKDANIQISEEDIKAYYQKHKDEYLEPEKRKIDYVLFETKPSAEDSADIRELAQSLLERAREGEDFAELAETHSDDPGSSSKGGDLGYFGRGAMVKPFEEAAFSANVGDIVGPVASRFGLHIIKVEDKKTEDNEEKVKVRHILLKFEPSYNTIEIARDRANYLVEMAKEMGFTEATQLDSLEVQTTQYFTKGNFIPGIGIERKANHFAFNKDVGAVSEVFQVDKGFLVFQVAEIQPERIKPLSDVRDQIENILRREKQKDLAGEFCRKVKEKLNKGLDFETVAQQDSLEIKQTEEFTMSSYVTGVGRDTKFIGTAFGLKVGEISNPIEGVKGYYLIRLEDKEPFNEKQFQSQKEMLRSEVLEKKQRLAYSNWFNDLKEKADIEDYRYNFF